MGILGKIAGAGLGAVGGLLGSRGSRKAAKRAAKAQRAAINEAINEQNRSFEDIRGYESPYVTGGAASQNRLMELLGLGGDTASADYGKYGQDFSMSDFEQDPGYAFRMSEGLKALDRQAAARGGLISGAALKASQRYGQDMASQEYQNAYNRYRTNRADQLNSLINMRDTGVGAVNRLGNQRSNVATNISNLRVGKGDVKAAGIIGQQDAKNQGIDAVTNALSSLLPF